MSSSSSERATLQGRLRAITAGRTIAAALVALTIATFGRDLVDPAGRSLLTWAIAIHLLVQLLAVALDRGGRLQRVTIDVTLLADVGAIGVLGAVTGGIASPMTALLLTEVVVVTLLFGRWAGLRASLLCTLAGAWLLASSPRRSTRLPTRRGGPTWPPALALTPTVRAALLLAVLWGTILATGWLTDLIERDLRRRTEDLTLLRDVTPDLDPRRGPDAVAGALAELLVDRLGHRASAVWLTAGDRLELHGTAHASDGPGTGCPTTTSLALDEDVVTSAFADHGILPIRRDRPRPEALVDLFGEQAPLVLVALGVDGDVIGLLAVEVATRFGRGPTLRVREVRLLRMLAEQSSLLLENARLQTELADQAVTDAVTGLPNHRYLQQRLGEELERVARGAGPRGAAVAVDRAARPRPLQARQRHLRPPDGRPRARRRRPRGPADAAGQRRGVPVRRRGVRADPARDRRGGGQAGLRAGPGRRVGAPADGAATAARCRR